ncbi:ATP-grasp domain-containing protein [Rhodohalobacter mucosus]|uniref:ATP-grasp domain-containing protein n=1 Tax=Rhodohalobacter mucosus TaxID=2079485 RepID=A0A316TT90_9BACT|nr:hypothetical protein [Rhodohalobacter mucosus]PWN07807.1 hypothetical protein DDZ15_01990 [Rhodohalobacter mucosus]
MKIAIQYKEGDFSIEWINYCKSIGIPFKVVDVYKNQIIDELRDCDAFMWHFHHMRPKDHIFAKQLLYSVESCGKTVFPNFQTAWHFDDKIGQKYLLEGIGAPLVPTYVFYDKQEAYSWVEKAHYPKVFKLRRGSGGNHVRLVDNEKTAKRLVNKAFGKGFNQYDAVLNLKERWRRYRDGKTTLYNVGKGVLRLGYTTKFSKTAGKERGYVYFQDYIPGNKYDMRISVVAGRCFGCLRPNRPGDFRASGSGLVSYDLEKIPESVIRIALEVANRLKLQSVAFDFVMDDKQPFILEMSYGFGVDPEDFDYGYWNSELEFIEGKFNPFGWMVDDVLVRANSNK